MPLQQISIPCELHTKVEESSDEPVAGIVNPLHDLLGGSAQRLGHFELFILRKRKKRFAQIAVDDAHARDKVRSEREVVAARKRLLRGAHLELQQLKKLD